jgi:DNA-binding protein HU-beta
LTKAELVERVVQDIAHRELSKAAVNEVVDSVFDNIAKAVRKDKRFTYPGFGTFSVRTRKARVGRNPQTGAEIRIKASKTVGFKPAPVLKESL